MDKRRAFLAYQLAVCVPLVVVSIYSIVTGTVLIATVPGLIATIALMLACLCCVHVALKNKVQGQQDALVALYDMKCDPQAMVNGGSKIAFSAMQLHENGDPLGEGDVWFLSIFALALIDTGDVANAEKIGAAILKDASEAKSDLSKAAMLINVEPLVLRLRGTEEAISVLEQALALLANDSSNNAQQLKAYADSEYKVLCALRDQDHDFLIKRFTQVMVSEHQPMRMRVLNADSVASIHRARGEETDEIQALNFVERYGNKLPVVAAAEERLEELLA